MKTKYLFLFVIATIFSINVFAVRSTIWTFDCSTKPDTIYYSWTTSPLMNRVTFADGIMTINSANAIYPRIVIPEPIDVTNFPTVRFMLRTSLADKRLQIQTRSFNSLLGPVLTQVSAPITGDGEWHEITLPLTPNNYTGNITISFREANDVTFATGIFEIDYIILGGTLTTSLPSDNKEQDIIVSPTLVENELIVRSSAGNDVELSVFSVTGAKLFTASTAKDQLRANLSALSAGSYLAVVKSGDKTVTKRFVKK